MATMVDDRHQPATLHDVARESGVSIATASRALNGSSRNVRESNVSRVLAAAAKLNYEPHLSAQAIARGSTRTAALVVNDINDPYFSSIAAGIIQAAEVAGLIVTMAVSDRSPQRELDIVRRLRGQRPQVIIIAGSRIDGAASRDLIIAELEAYQSAGGHVVLVSQQDLPFSTVTIDNVGGARQLARSLVGRGYQRFAVIRAVDRFRTSRDRLSGFTSGLRQARIRVDDRHSVETEFTRSGGYDAASELVARGLDGVDVVFAVNDVMAIGAMTAFRDAGLVPGRDIAVAGFDDIGSAVDVTPTLTSVAVPLHEVGLSAMRLALSDEDRPGLVRISTKVVLRESTPAR
jgi:LacI family transcriptional regulator